MNDIKHTGFDTADITALSHLYRGEVYRSTVWRTRLDTTTNWAVVTTGLALSMTFSSETASPLPLVLVGLLVAVFLLIEARRYRFFDFFRIRAHIMEVYSFGAAWPQEWNPFLGPLSPSGSLCAFAVHSTRSSKDDLRGDLPPQTEAEAA